MRPSKRQVQLVPTRGSCGRAGDQRGFALQVAILTTALIAIAVAVSAVIITRGGEVVDDLERQRITIQPSDINNQAQCEQVYEWTWDDTAKTCSN